MQTVQATKYCSTGRKFCEEMEEMEREQFKSLQHICEHTETF